MTVENTQTVSSNPAPGMRTLTKEQIEFFQTNGYVVLNNCFSREQAAYWLKDVWVRLNLNPNDKSTWHNREAKEDTFGAKVHMPAQRRVLVKDFAPKAWGAVLDLVGDDEDNIVERTKYWGDNFIVNLGHKEYDESRPGMNNPKELPNWHVDGDFFRHFLTSGEQGLLITPIWSDEIKHRGGATYVAPDSIGIVAKYLYDHPEGVMPGFDNFDYRGLADQCNKFVECVGNVGDVVICHPFMLHSASYNVIRVPRFITNPPISLKTPFKYDKPESELSIVEKTTLKALGKKSLSYEITGTMETFPSKRADMWSRVKSEELERLRSYGTADAFESF
ncbi:hypothetical protein AWJ20_1793 [Sugiyamaella lignohabitans]|uniref:Phytanoyl-CoA dioxygenase n=1 Tax=Sugiyamaella lignohabitans TaxID=796027 RepID=A0A167E0F0_9ASCO|nr:uncharacterized protein AWJ20_1793 [Sugiyamaella lignohabitans]ANB13499.1 hypothetical protein AWJ20_1793 [Sugiyamaella lignohabitans]